MQELGYNFFWAKLDAQSFLLRQRRLRVWGVSDLMSHTPAEDFRNRMQNTLESLSGNELLNFDDVFDRSMPKQRLKSEQQQSKLKQAVAKARLSSADPDEIPNVFIDVATSKDRGVESAENVSTCVRPSHAVYSHLLGRTLSVKELWNCQGLFESAFVNPAAVREIMQNQSQAQDLAGQVVSETHTHKYTYICDYMHI